MNELRNTSFTALALLLCASTAQAAELTTNGDFETGDFTGWQEIAGTGTIEITSTNPSAGTFAAHLNADLLPGAGPGATLIRAANIGIGQVSPGQEVTISFDVRGSAAIGGVAFAEFFTELAGGGVSSSQILSGAPLVTNPDPNVWTTLSYTAIVGPDASGGVTLQLAAICGAATGCLSDYTFDNVSVTIESELSLGIDAVCGGPGAVFLSGATPNGPLAVARGSNINGFVLPGGPCGGTQIDLGNPTLMSIISADAAGEYFASPNFPAGACGIYFQVVDLTTCAVSNLQQL